MPGRPGLVGVALDRAGGQIVGDRASSRVPLRRRVGREADDGVRAEDVPGDLGRGVVLANVYAVRPARQRQVGPVVEDERHAELGADPRGHFRPSE